jgi:fluoride ion exporter CrcB/FEX
MFWCSSVVVWERRPSLGESDVLALVGPDYPAGTLVVNITGSILSILGLIAGMVIVRVPLS